MSRIRNCKRMTRAFTACTRLFRQMGLERGQNVRILATGQSNVISRANYIRPDPMRARIMWIYWLEGGFKWYRYHELVRW